MSHSSKDIFFFILFPLSILEIERGKRDAKKMSRVLECTLHEFNKKLKNY